MKKIIVLFLVALATQAKSQSLIDSLSSLSFNLEDSVGEKLVDFAMQNASLKVIDKQVEQYKYEVKATRASWLNVASASFNVNEISLKQSSTSVNQNIYYPKYNFNLSVPLGLFFTKGPQIKQSQAKAAEFGERKKVEANKLRESVLKTYQNYILNKYLLALQETVVQDELIAYKQAEGKFKNKELKLEDFTDASKRFSSELVKRVTLMHDVNSSKIELEALIGMSYEDAMKKITVQKSTVSNNKR